MSYVEISANPSGLETTAWILIRQYYLLYSFLQMLQCLPLVILSVNGSHYLGLPEELGNKCWHSISEVQGCESLMFIHPKGCSIDFKQGDLFILSTNLPVHLLKIVRWVSSGLLVPLQYVIDTCLVSYE